MAGKNRSPKRRIKNSTNPIRSIIKAGKWFLIGIGFFACLAIILSFTDIPYFAYYRLGTANTKLSDPPDMIVILSGSGMPSPDGLIRAYYGVEASRKFPDAKIIIALPYDDKNSLKPLKLMAYELTVKGIDSTRIVYEPLGFNTRSQAMNIAAIYPNNQNNLSLLLITSPEHTYRSVKTFIKAGFTKVGGLAAFDTPIDPEKVTDQDISRDIRIKSLSLRYNMWSYLHYELIVMREYCAIGYYKLKGWI
jgi:uncharacterized SAM-binding protein YcdF (DUF218 family)